MLFQTTSSTRSAKLASIANTSELYRGAKAGQDESNAPKSLINRNLRRFAFFAEILVTTQIETKLMSNRVLQTAKLAAPSDPDQRISSDL